MNGPNISAITNAKQNTDVRLMFLLDVKGRHLSKVPVNSIHVDMEPIAHPGSSDANPTNRPLISAGSVCWPIRVSRKEKVYDARAKGLNREFQLEVFFANPRFTDCGVCADVFGGSSLPSAGPSDNSLRCVRREEGFDEGLGLFGASGAQREADFVRYGE